MILVGTGCPCCARVRPGQGCGLPAFPAPRGRRGPRGPGRPARAVARRAMRSALEAGVAARTLSGRSKDSGGAAASFARPAQRARRGHAAAFPARKRTPRLRQSVLRRVLGVLHVACDDVGHSERDLPVRADHIPVGVGVAALRAARAPALLVDGPPRRYYTARSGRVPGGASSFTPPVGRAAGRRGRSSGSS